MKFIRPALVLLCLSAYAEAFGQAVLVSEHLDSTVLTSRRAGSPVIRDRSGVERVDIRGLASMPSLLGNADPVRFLTSLPGVETGNELDAGLHVQGSESSHSVVMMQGVPVYGAKHLLGLFSVFTPSHFSTLRFSQKSSDSGRLGAEVDVRLPEGIPRETEADLSLGLVSGQGTVRFPIGKKSVLSLSGRGSFINLVYKDAIKLDGEPISYGFRDGNLSFISNPGPEDHITLNFYSGSDAGSYHSAPTSLMLDSDWRNTLASVSWRHKSVEQQLFWTSYALDLNLSFNTMGAGIPSDISTAGYRIAWNDGRWNLCAEALWHDAVLQFPYLDGVYSATAGSAERQTGLESTLSVSYERDFTADLSAVFSARGSSFLDPERKTHWDMSPDVTLRYNMRSSGRLEFSAGTRVQYLFQTGVTNLGFPCEFWFLSGRHSSPQHSAYGILSYAKGFGSEVYEIKADLYYRHLTGQVEYVGDVFDFVGGNYSLDNSIIRGWGRNFGLSLMLHKQSGNLTGWVSYNLGRSLRSFDVPGYAGEYPSNHERLHELNVVASWNARNWSAGLSMVAASGTPFTAPDAFYVVSGRIVSHFGAHNSSRLSPYFRTDLSLNWYFIRTSSRTFGANFSVYNATMRQNEILCRLFTKEGTFAYRPLTLGFSILPSLSLFYRL